jgi:UDP-N-acetylglucosamine 2-epimerase (non-hydrolysing)
LFNIIAAYDELATETLPVILSVHPRTRSKLTKEDIEANPNIKFCEPFGFFDFVKLEEHALCILTDSGTVQEEACLLRVPCVVVRKSTERPETIECGATILSGLKSSSICESYNYAIKMNLNWKIPEEYLYTDVSDRMINYLINKGV